jgi:hypothetical protein
MINQFSNEEIEWAKNLDPSRLDDFYRQGGEIKNFAELQEIARQLKETTGKLDRIFMPNVV